MKEDNLIEIIPKEKKKTPRWVNSTILFAIILLLAVGGGYYFLEKKVSSLEQKETKIESNIKATRKNIDSFVKGAEINVLADKIEKFSSIFENHKIVSKAIAFLNAHCHPNIQFKTLSLDSEKGTALIEASTDNFENISQQLAVLKENKDVESCSQKAKSNPAPPKRVITCQSLSSWRTVTLRK